MEAAEVEHMKETCRKIDTVQYKCAYTSKFIISYLYYRQLRMSVDFNIDIAHSRKLLLQIFSTRDTYSIVHWLLKSKHSQ